MALIAKSTTNASTQVGNTSASIDVEESFEQMTLKAAADTDEGVPVYINTSGNFAACNASSAGTAVFYGITTRKVKAGEAVTAIARGVVSGFNLSSQAYGAPIYLADTAGRLGDAVGTVTRKVAEVVPVLGQTRGSNPGKLLRIIG